MFVYLFELFIQELGAIEKNLLENQSKRNL